MRKFIHLIKCPPVQSGVTTRQFTVRYKEEGRSAEAITRPANHPTLAILLSEGEIAHVSMKDVGPGQAELGPQIVVGGTAITSQVTTGWISTAEAMEVDAGVADDRLHQLRRGYDLAEDAPQVSTEVEPAGEATVETAAAELAEAADAAEDEAPSHWSSQTSSEDEDEDEDEDEAEV